MADTTKLSTMAGPATVAAARPVSVKIPAPMMTLTPKTVRSSAVRFFLSWYSGSSVSAMDCSILFVRRTPTGPDTSAPIPPHRRGPANTLTRSLRIMDNDSGRQDQFPGRVVLEVRRPVHPQVGARPGAVRSEVGGLLAGPALPVRAVGL